MSHFNKSHRLHRKEFTTLSKHMDARFHEVQVELEAMKPGEGRQVTIPQRVPATSSMHLGGDPLSVSLARNSSVESGTWISCGELTFVGFSAVAHCEEVLNGMDAVADPARDEECRALMTEKWDDTQTVERKLKKALENLGATGIYPMAKSEMHVYGMDYFFTFSSKGIRISHWEKVHELQWNKFDPENPESEPSWVWGSLRDAIRFFENPRIE